MSYRTPHLMLAALAALTTAQATTVQALPGDLSTRFPINDEDPSKSVPSEAERNGDPMEFGYWLQDMLARAEGAYTERDWKSAVKYYNALHQGLPESAAPLSRLCHSYRMLREPGPALDACSKVLVKKGAKAIDHINYLGLLLNKPAFSGDDKELALASLNHLREFARQHPQALHGQRPAQLLDAREPKGKAGAGAGTASTANDQAAWHELEDPEARAQARERILDRVRESMEARLDRTAQIAEANAKVPHLPTQIEVLNCRLGVRVRDGERLAQCIDRLRGYKFSERLLMPFKWAKTLIDGDEQASLAMIADSQELGLDRAAVASLREEHDRTFHPEKFAEAGPVSRPAVIGAVGAALLALAIVIFLRRRRPSDATA